MSAEKINEIAELIRAGKLDEALICLNKSDFKNQKLILMLEFRLNTLKNHFHHGMISYEEFLELRD